MLDLTLPDLLPDTSLPFRNASGCKEWLATFPLTNTTRAHHTMTEVAEQLNLTALPPIERLKIIELLREHATFLQDEFSRHYAGKPIPLNETDRNAWKQAQRLWEQFKKSYRYCLASAAHGDSGTANHLVLITQRCLHYVGLQLQHYNFAYEPVNASLWQELHELYQFIEQRGASKTQVKDSLEGEQRASSCEAAYVQALLMQAARPEELTALQIRIAGRILQTLAPKVTVSEEMLLLSEATPLAVDLAGQQGAVSMDLCLGGDSLRFLDMDPFRESLRRRIRKLQDGATPLSCGLPEALVQIDGIALLQRLQLHWCEGGGKPEASQAYAGEAAIGFGIGSIHFLLTGDVFAQPEEERRLSAREQEEIRLFGRISEHTKARRAAEQNVALEHWQIVDMTLTGYRLRRPERLAAGLVIGQLAALQVPGRDGFMLGSVRALSNDSSKGFLVVIGLLPGKPVAVAVRNAGTAVANKKFVPGFYLPPVPAMGTPPSLIFAPGTLQSKLLEIYNARPLLANTARLLEKGPDYERFALKTEPV